MKKRMSKRNQSSNTLRKVVLILVIAFGYLPVMGQSEALKYLKTKYGGKLDGVKTVKVYNYNASNGNVMSNFKNNNFYQMTILEKDKYNRTLYDLTIKLTETGLDSNYGYKFHYEVKNGDLILQNMYTKWPDKKQYYSIRNTYTSSGKIKTKETTARNTEGKPNSYKKIIYDYDELNRLIQERDSSTNDSFLKIYSQIITKYYYDTLGVKCFIEANKIQNHSGFTELVSKEFLTDSIGTTNRKYTYKLSSYPNLSEYVQFDKNKNNIRRYSYKRKTNWHDDALDSTLIKDQYSTYNSQNQKTYYENKLERSYLKYVYNHKNQIIERSGKNHYVEQKEYFKYDNYGHIIEYIDSWNGSISKKTYSNFNDLGIACIEKYHGENDEISHVTRREFTYWP